MFRKFCLRTAGVREYINKQTILWQTFYYDKEQSALVNFAAQKIAPLYCMLCDISVLEFSTRIQY